MCKYILQTNVVKCRYTNYAWLCVFVRGLLQFVVHTYTPWNALQGTLVWTTQQICWIGHTWRPQNALGAGVPWTTNCRNFFHSQYTANGAPSQRRTKPTAHPATGTLSPRTNALCPIPGYPMPDARCQMLNAKYRK